MNSIRTHFVRIGNSRGLRIPKALIDQLGLSGEVEIAVQDDGLVIQPVRQRREGWDQAFRKMAKQNDDVLLDNEQPTEWEKSEWEW